MRISFFISPQHMMQTVLKRKFWNLAKGKAAGYIESVHETGTILKHPEITFRETTSNLASSGQVACYSTSLLSIENSVLLKIMSSRKPVVIGWKVDWIGSPLRGWIRNAVYVTDISNMSEETISIAHQAGTPSAQ